MVDRKNPDLRCDFSKNDDKQGRADNGNQAARQAVEENCKCRIDEHVS